MAKMFGAAAEKRRVQMSDDGNGPRDLDRNQQHQTVDQAAERAVTIAAEGEEREEREEERVERADPAPMPSQIAAKRSGQLVDNVTDQALLELRRLRDQIDDLMRDMEDRRSAIKESIMGQAEFAETCMAAKGVIGEHVTKLRANFESSLTPIPGRRND